MLDILSYSAHSGLDSPELETQVRQVVNKSAHSPTERSDMATWSTARAEVRAANSGRIK